MIWCHSIQVIDKLVGEAHSNAHNQTIFLNIITPPVLETVRIACRTVVTTSPVKLCPFPCWDELLGRLLGKMLAEKHKICHNIEEAKVKVLYPTLTLTFCSVHDGFGNT